MNRQPQVMCEPLLLPCTAVEVELSSGGWLGGGSLGRVRVPVGDLVQRRRIAETFRLEGGEGQAELEVEYKPYF